MAELRKIIHIDMDAFFASVEQRDFPEYRGKPLAVGGSKERGVVSAASYEARKYGVFSAMSSKIAAQKCPELIFAAPRFDVYKQVSDQIRSIFHEYTDLVEPLSLDEAYLDVTHTKLHKVLATEIALEIKQKIFEQTQLTASAGVSFNKFLAKVASDVQKPNGLTLIHPSKAQEFVDQLPIEKFFGIGKVTAQKMKSLGIFNGKDLQRYSELQLIRMFGKSGSYFYHIARCIDNRPVQPNRVRKSVGSETTFNTDLARLDDLKTEIEKLLQDVWNYLSNKEIQGRTITLKIKFSDFTQITRSKTSLHYLTDKAFVLNVLYELLEAEYPYEKSIRLLGVSISNLNNQLQNGSLQLTLDF